MERDAYRSSGNSVVSEAVVFGKVGEIHADKNLRRAHIGAQRVVGDIVKL